MERFRARVSSLYGPRCLVASTPECDAAIRERSTYSSLYSVLCETNPAVRYATREAVGLPARRPDLGTLRGIVEEGGDIFKQNERKGIGGVVGKIVGVWVGEEHVVTGVKKLIGEVKSCCGVIVVLRKGMRLDESRKEIIEQVRKVVGKEWAMDVEVLDDWDGKQAGEIARGWVAGWLKNRMRRVKRRVEAKRQTIKTTLKYWWNAYSSQKKDASENQYSQQVTSPTVPISAEWGRESRQLAAGIDESPEALTHELADLQFANGDYQAALANYRLCQSDLRYAPNSDLESALVFEMGALSLIMAEASRPRDVGSMLDEAINRYARASKRDAALRTAILFTEYCLAVGYASSAASVLLRSIPIIYPDLARSPAQVLTDDYDEFINAILLSKVAGAMTIAGKRRRAALYAWYAAEKFQNVDAHKSSMRAVVEVARGFDGIAEAWKSVSLYLGVQLGEQDLRCGRVSAAFDQFGRLITSGGVSENPALQKSVVSGYFNAARLLGWDNGTAAKDIEDRTNSLLFPIVNSEALVIRTADSSPRLYKKPRSSGHLLAEKSKAMQIKHMIFCNEIMWSELEDHLLEQMWNDAEGRDHARKKIMLNVVISGLKNSEPELLARKDLHARWRSTRTGETRRQALRSASSLRDVTFPHEEITVQIPAYNPLDYSLYLADITAVTSFVPEDLSSDSLSNCHSNSLRTKDYSEAKGAIHDSVKNSSSSNVSHVQAPIHSPVVIPPKQEHLLELKVVVLTTGVLTITGARWRFACSQESRSPPTDFVPGHAKLMKKRKRLNATRHQRASEVPLYAPAEGFKVLVRPSAPKLEVSWPYGEEISLDAGEYIHSRITVENVSPAESPSAVDALWFKLSHAAVVWVDIDDHECVRCGGKLVRNSEDTKVQNRTPKCASTTKADSPSAGCITGLRLKKNERLNIPVVIRASPLGFTASDAAPVGGTPTMLNVAILFGYHPTSARFLRLAARLCIRPSVSAFVRVVHSDGNKGCAKQKLIGIEIQHDGLYASSQTYELTGIALRSSSGFKLSHVPLSGDAYPHFFLKPRDSTLLFVCCSVPDDPGSAISSPSAAENVSKLNLYRMGSVDGALESNYPFGRFSQESDSMSVDLPEIGSFFLYWKSGASHGEVPVWPGLPSDWVRSPNERVGKRSISTSGASISELDVRVEHVRCLSHDFSDGPCIVPVTIIVGNTSNVLVNARIDVPVDEVADGSRGRYWAGDRSVQMKHMSPGAVRKGQLQAVVDAPGTYDVGKLVVTVGDKSETSYTLPSPVQVLDKGSSWTMNGRAPRDGFLTNDFRKLSPTSGHVANGNGVDERMTTEKRFSAGKALGKEGTSAISSKSDDGVWDVADTDDDD